MDLHARLRKALDPLPAGALVPVEWVRGLVEEGGEGEGADLTVQEFGAHLDRAPSTIRTWCGSGKIPGAYRLQGREWRIPRSALRELRNGSGGKPASRDADVDLSSWREVGR